MSQNERLATLAKIEELSTRVGALAAAAKLIEAELIQLQRRYYRETEGCTNG